MSERSRRKKALLSQPESKTTKGIAGGIGLLPDGSLNIFILGTPPSRWFHTFVSLCPSALTIHLLFNQRPKFGSHVLSHGIPFIPTPRNLTGDR
jgi:hypothetical protein